MHKIAGVKWTSADIYWLSDKLQRYRLKQKKSILGVNKNMKKAKSIKVKVIAIFTVLCALIALISAFFNFLLPLYLSYKFNIDTRGAGSIGIIGGADGPTAIFVSGQISPHWFTTAFVLLTLLGIMYLVVAKYKKNQN